MRRGRPRARTALALVALLALCACGSGEQEERPVEPPAAAQPARARPPGARPSVLVLGLDGADWHVLDPLIEAGYLPQLGALVRGGARADLDCAPAHPETACFCPPVWLSISTGVPESRHGIVFVTDTVAQRKARALWTLLALRGGTTTAVAWRNTWPPEDSIRYVLTEDGLDWVADQRFKRWPATITLRMNRAESRARPLDLFEQLGLVPYSGPRRGANAALARDRVSMLALLRLAPRDPTDLTLVLMHSPDKLAHLRWDTVQPEPGGPFDRAALLAQAQAWRDAPDRAVARATVASPYLEIDAWLGELFAAAHWDYVLVASDHGMTRSRNPNDMPGQHGPHEPEAHIGVFALSGPGVRPGSRLGGIDVFDVAPTLAWLLGLPVARDLPGHVLLEAFQPDFVTAHPVAQVASWEQSGP